ncbi:hypothetical protein GBAR_LOCUS6305 [Geodia barretti]|uniref:Uncharacterized protein n=1 Tax=Geodia barretti TaxID=519541 RepID=A0AA35RES8_GEOBA|nr:hypothetical protein GBAR_LOCUS6305 [Geodia barretti]
MVCRSITRLLLETPELLVPARQTRTPGALSRFWATSTSSRVSSSLSVNGRESKSWYSGG